MPKTRLIKGSNLVELHENYQGFLNEEAMSRDIVQRMPVNGEVDLKECQEVIDVQQFINAIQEVNRLQPNQVNTRVEYFLLITYK